MAEANKRARIHPPHAVQSIAVTTGGEVAARVPTSNAEQLESSRFIRRVILIALVVVGALLVWFTREVLLLVFGGVLLAVFFSGLTDVVTRYVPVSRGMALGGILLVLTTLVSAGILFLGAELLEQFEELSKGLSASLTTAQEYLEATPLHNLFRRPPNGGQDPITTLGQIAGVVSTSVWVLAAPVIALAIGIYVAIDPYLYRQGLLYLVRPERRERVGDVLHQTAGVLWGWLMGRAFSMTLIGLTTFIGLWLLGIPMALSLGLIAFVLNFIPYLGPPLSAAPAVLIAMTLGTNEVIYVLLLYAAIQFVETYFLTPLVEHQAVSLPPAFTLSVQLLMGVVLGFLGVLVATPLAATAVVLIKTLYIEDVLGDHPKLHREAAREAEAAQEAREAEEAQRETA